jgi:hypothetical protein
MILRSSPESRFEPRRGDRAKPIVSPRVPLVARPPTATSTFTQTYADTNNSSDTSLGTDNGGPFAGSGGALW